MEKPTGSPSGLKVTPGQRFCKERSGRVYHRWGLQNRRGSDVRKENICLTRRVSASLDTFRA